MRQKISKALSILMEMLLLAGILLTLYLLHWVRDPWKLGVIAGILAIGFAVRQTKPDIARRAWITLWRWVFRIFATAVFFSLVAVIVFGFFWLRGPVATSTASITRWDFLSRMAPLAGQRTCQNELYMIYQKASQFTPLLLAYANQLSLQTDEKTWKAMAAHPANLTEKKFTEGNFSFTTWLVAIEIKNFLLAMRRADSSSCVWPDGYYDFYQMQELEALSPGKPTDALFVVLQHLTQIERKNAREGASGGPG